MPATSKVRQLWPTYVANLQLYCPELPDVFLCPVCLQDFTSDVLDSLSECPISEGHIFPKSLGGNEVTLECRACNNDLGSSVDASMSGEFKWRKCQDVGGEWKAMISTAKGRRPVTILQSESEIQIHDLKNHPLPAGMSEERMLGLFDQPWSLTFYTKHKPSMVPIATFHSAHLLLFRLFGYEYALSAGGRAVGMWLRERSLPVGIGEACQSLTAANVVPLEVGRCGIALVDGIRCFAVCVPVYGESTRRVALLPAFERIDFEAYVSVFDGISKKMNLTVRQVGEHASVEALADERYRWFGHFLMERGSAESSAAVSDGYV